jgi:hypothetical protein
MESNCLRVVVGYSERPSTEDWTTKHVTDDMDILLHQTPHGGDL